MEYTYNKEYLMRDNKPWFPVMGEFHYSRYRDDLWEESLRKMKAGGVIVAYIIEDRFTVPGSMNRFQHSVDICLYLFLRTGVARFVIDFKSHYGRIVLIGYSGIRIDMFH